MRVCVVLLAVSFGLSAADAPLDLLEAARKGDAKSAAAMLAKGADIEMRDRDGKTPLMLAAQYGRTSIVKLLLDKGAKAEARDSQHWNAYMWALLQPSGGVIHTRHDAVLKLLPQPKRLRLGVVTNWSTGATLFSSCFLRPEELKQHMRQLHPDGFVVEALRQYAVSSGRDMMAIVSTDVRGTSAAPERHTPEDVDGVLTLNVEPGVSCVQPVDRLTMKIDAGLKRPDSQKPLMDKSFGGGVKVGKLGLDAANPNQYEPIYRDWAKSQAAAIYWAVVTALLTD